MKTEVLTQKAENNLQRSYYLLLDYNKGQRLQREEERHVT